MEYEKGMPLKNNKGEIIKCEYCGGIYKWDVLFFYPTLLNYLFIVINVIVKLQ